MKKYQPIANVTERFAADDCWLLSACYKTHLNAVLLVTVISICCRNCPHIISTIECTKIDYDKVQKIYIYYIFLHPTRTLAMNKKLYQTPFLLLHTNDGGELPYFHCKGGTIIMHYYKNNAYGCSGIIQYLPTLGFCLFFFRKIRINHFEWVWCSPWARRLPKTQQTRHPSPCRYKSATILQHGTLLMLWPKCHHAATRHPSPAVTQVPPCNTAPFSRRYPSATIACCNS